MHMAYTYYPLDQEFIMQRIPLLSALLLLAGVLPAAASPLSFQDSTQPGWYVGVGAGQARYPGLDGNTVNGAFGNGGWSATGSSADSEASSWKVFGGYTFGPNLAVEAAYVDLGRVDLHSTVTAVNGSAISATPIGGHFKVNRGGYVDAVGIWPVNETVSVFGKLGAYSLRTELSASGNGLSMRSTDRNADMTFGAGLTVALDKGLGLRGEWERFRKVGDDHITGRTDIDLFTLGLVYSF
jgi:OOP family OmpA-OmpF porin